MKFLSKFYIFIVFAILYAPILVVILFSFNASGNLSSFSGFTLYWYEDLFRSGEAIEALKNSEPVIPEFDIAGDGVITEKYATESGSVVRVEYEGGVNFILNYNSFDITVQFDGQIYTIGALGFVRID